MSSAAPALAQLSAEHERIADEFLCWLEAVAAGEAAAVRARFAAFEQRLLRHADMEERHLLPVFTARGLETAGCTAAILRAEHDKLRRCLAEARAALPAGAAPLPPRLRVEQILACHLLRELLAHHDAREREAFFPALDAALTPAERAALYAICAASQASASSREASPPSSCNS